MAIEAYRDELESWAERKLGEFGVLHDRPGTLILPSSAPHHRESHQMKVQVIKVPVADKVQAQVQAEAQAKALGAKVIGTYVVRVAKVTINVAVVTE